MSTTTGVMHNLPVLWLAVGLLSLCHAPVPIVGQLKVALLLCVVHAVQCAVSVPGLRSRQQWQLVWAGPRVLLCSMAELGHPGGCGQPWHKGCRQQKGPGFSLSVCLCVLFSQLHLKPRPQRATEWEKNIMEVMRARQPSDQIAQGLSQPLCNELTSSKSTSQHAEMFGFLFYFLSLFFFCFFAVLVTTMMLSGML